MSSYIIILISCSNHMKATQMLATTKGLTLFSVNRAGSEPCYCE